MSFALNPSKAKLISIFGSTGTIGVNTLKVLKNSDIQIECLAANKNYELLNEQIQEYKPKLVFANKDILHLIKHKEAYDINELERHFASLKSDGIVNAIVAFAGLKLSLLTQKYNKKLYLANKESLLVAGKFLDTSKISPIDSEHSALAALLRSVAYPKKITITASGGTFFKQEDCKNLKAKDALKHPNWQMGAKITIDSATMANKLFELVEAKHLYKDLELDALIEPSSLIHAFCECKNNSITAYFSVPDMKLSIANALFKEDSKAHCNALDLLKIKNLSLYEIDEKKYPIYSLKNELLKNLDLGVIINAANEVYVEKYLKDECGYYDIYYAIMKALDKFCTCKIDTIEDVFTIDNKVRGFLNG